MTVDSFSSAAATNVSRKFSSTTFAAIIFTISEAFDAASIPP